MRKVLILEGSPRLKGNSSILSDEFARGAEEAGYCVEKIHVAWKKVAGCLGCNACYRSGGVCVQKDDMEEIREKMLASDVIVLASPIYFYSMTAQLKAVLDRAYAFFSQLAGKRFYFIITCAAPDEALTETMQAALRGFTRNVLSRTFSSNSQKAHKEQGRESIADSRPWLYDLFAAAHICRTSFFSIRLILSLMVSVLVVLKCTRTL